MAMTKCKECKKDVSTSAKSCPHCGIKDPGVTALDSIIGFIILGAIGWAIYHFAFANNEPISDVQLQKTHVESYSQSINKIKTFNNTKTNNIENIIQKSKLHFSCIKGSILKCTFTINNNSQYTIKDIEIECTHLAKSGTKIDSNSRTIYDVVNANTQRTFSDFNMGFVHSQAEKSSCKIKDLKIN